MWRSFFFVWIVFTCFSVQASQGTGEKRVALIVGNWAYPSSPLINPKNDAAGMAAALRQMDFEVLLHQNLTQKAFLQAITEFGQKIENGGVALFFFAGHGMQIKGKSKYPPAKPGALVREPLKAAIGGANALPIFAPPKGGRVLTPSGCSYPSWARWLDTE